MMNKLKYIPACILCCAAVSCGDDGVTFEKTPVISITVASDVPATVYPGETIEFQFDLNYDKGLKDAYASIDGVAREDTRQEFPEGTANASISFTYEAPDTYAGNSIDFAITASGADGAVGHYDIPVFVLAAKSQISINIPDEAPAEFAISDGKLEFTVNIKSANVDIKSVTTYMNETVMPAMSFDVTDGDARNVDVAFSYTPSLGDTGAPTDFTFEVLDVNGNITTGTYTVKFFKAPSLELNEYSATTMGLNKCTKAGQFLNMIDNVVYTANGVGAQCANVDMAVFWSGNTSTKGVALASPNVFNVTSIYPDATIIDVLGGTADDVPLNWKVRNRLSFRDITLSAEEYAMIETLAEIKNLFDGAAVPDNELVSFQKKAGSAVAFKVERFEVDPETGSIVEEDGTGVVKTVKYGILRVTACPAVSNTGTITFDYKIEK